MRPLSTSGCGTAGSSEVTPSERARFSNVTPWTSVEVTTTKKTAFRIWSDPSTPAITGSVASQIGTAPRSPAQPSISRSRMSNGAKIVETQTATGRARKISTAESSSPFPATSTSSLGKTSSPSRKKSAICEIHARPWWKTTIVRRAGIRPLPRIRAAM